MNEPADANTTENISKDTTNGEVKAPTMTRKILSLDPSINHVGFATLQIYDDGTAEWKWGVWHLEGTHIVDRWHDLRAYIQMHIGTDFDTLVIEWPQFYNSTKGSVAAKQGYTINLAAIGAFVAGWFGLPPDRIHLITAPQWKGTQTKQITAKRFFRAFDLETAQVDNNAIDAAMLLLAWARGELLV